MKVKQQQLSQYPFLSPSQISKVMHSQLHIQCEGEFQLSSKEGQFKSILEIRQEILLLYSVDKKEIKYAFELGLSVAYKVQRQKTSKNQTQLSQISALKFIIQTQITQIFISFKKCQKLSELHKVLEGKCVFQSGIKDNYRPYHHLPSSSNLSYCIANCLLSSEQVLMKSFNKSLLEDEYFNSSFKTQFFHLKRYKFKHVVQLLKVFKSSNSVYMMYQKSDCSLKQYIQVHGYPSKNDKKIIIKMLLKALEQLHERNIVHGSLDFTSIVMIEDGDKYVIKMGNFIKCCRSEESQQKRKDIAAVGHILQQLLNEKVIFIEEKLRQSEVNEEKQTNQFMKLLEKKKDVRELLLHPYLHNIQIEKIAKVK